MNREKDGSVVTLPSYSERMNQVCNFIEAHLNEDLSVEQLSQQAHFSKYHFTGRCARIRHFGSHEQMDDKIRLLYQQWLPQSGEQLRDYPCFFHYVNLFPDVAEHELITDIYLPLI